jgi:hypothetical protein
MNNRYMMRGVSAAKEDVHNAIKHIDKGIFPQAFCKIIPDILGGDPEYCNIMHADGAGTKSSLAYVYWKETGDLIGLEGHCAGRYRHEHRRPALCGSCGQHPRVEHHRAQQDADPR